jgi:hypothetical protein
MTSPGENVDWTGQTTQCAVVHQDGPVIIAEMILTNAQLEPAHAQMMQSVKIRKADMNAFAHQDILEMEKLMDQDVPISMNVTNKAITAAHNLFVLIMTEDSRANADQDLLETHLLSDVPNQRDHKAVQISLENSKELISDGVMDHQSLTSHAAWEMIDIWASAICR